MGEMTVFFQLLNRLHNIYEDSWSSGSSHFCHVTAIITIYSKLLRCLFRDDFVLNHELPVVHFSMARYTALSREDHAEVNNCSHRFSVGISSCYVTYV
ncbi:hypothetical protein E2C01_068541 [Portunus trituberculatus]|uniref:Uncharacterized protein n=1 Tax=Portunus trituberculatus TaxID=210409 RepID=A0A5B7HMP4_PORTR|nr:hypothetical protein [Portunus trituberculatus]